MTTSSLFDRYSPFLELPSRSFIAPGTVAGCIFLTKTPNAVLVFGDFGALIHHTTTTTASSQRLLMMDRDILHAAISADDNFIFFAEVGHKQVVSASFSGEELGRTPPFDFDVRCIATHPHIESLLAVGDSDGCVHLLDGFPPERKRDVMTLSNHFIRHVSFKGEFVVACEESATHVIPLNGNGSSAGVRLGVEGSNCAVFSSDMKLLAVGGKSGVFVFDAATWEESAKFSGKGGIQNAVLSVAFLPGTSCIVSSGLDHRLQYFDVAANAERRSVFAGRFRGQHVTLSPDGRFCSMVGRDSNEVVIYQVQREDDVRRQQEQLAAAALRVWSAAHPGAPPPQQQQQQPLKWRAGVAASVIKTVHDALDSFADPRPTIEELEDLSNLVTARETLRVWRSIHSSSPEVQQSLQKFGTTEDEIVSSIFFSDDMRPPCDPCLYPETLTILHRGFSRLPRVDRVPIEQLLRLPAEAIDARDSAERAGTFDTNWFQKSNQGCCDSCLIA